MSLGNTTEADIVAYIFLETPMPDYGTNTLYVALHTADTGEAGSQTTSEISYTGYSRVSVARTSGGWTVSGNQASNAAAVTFGQMTAGAGGTVTHATIGTASSGAGQIIASGAVSPTVLVTNGVTPSFAIGALVFTLD